MKQLIPIEVELDHQGQPRLIHMRDEQGRHTALEVKAVYLCDPIRELDSSYRENQVITVGYTYKIRTLKDNSLRTFKIRNNLLGDSWELELEKTGRERRNHCV